MTHYPTPWQRRLLWTVATFLAVVAGGAASVWLLSLFGKAVGFLQPVLIPFALAAVLAFLLEPIVRLITTRTRLSRTWAVWVVFVMIALVLGVLGALLVPRLYDSTARMVQGMPAYTQKAQKRLLDLLDATEKRLDHFQSLFPDANGSPSPSPGEAAAPDAASSTAANSVAAASPASSLAAAPPAATGNVTPLPSPTAPPEVTATPGGELAGNEADKPSIDDRTGDPATADFSDAKPTAAVIFKPNGLRNYLQKQIPSLESRVPALLDSLLRLFWSSLGAAGILFNAIIIPVYLYFLLVESRNIARHWNEYLPIRDSPFKKEVVSVLLEINGYLASFFRGQLIVSTIDGILIGGSLALFVHLDFAFLIGLLVVVLTFIPYLGIILCYIPAVLVAIIQYGDWWHPLYVVAIMFVVQTLESTIIAPKIVGDSVGLHPVTVILSVLGWSLLLNGPLGAILAVPLSATIKVLLRRYIWEASGRGRHLIPTSGASVAALDDESQRADEARAEADAADGGAAVAHSPPRTGQAPTLGIPTVQPSPPVESRPGAASIPSAGLRVPPVTNGEGREPTRPPSS